MLKTVLLFVLALMITGCSHHGPLKPSRSHWKQVEQHEEIEFPDGPPEADIDVNHIPNATPKLEPLSRFGNPGRYEVFGVRYHTLPHSQGYSAEGTASWYGRKFHGLRTSSGEPYDMFGMTAAHRSLPLPTYAKVQNLHNGKEVIVKINDRGPFVKDRLIDLSYAAAKKLGIHAAGTGKVRITAIDPDEWHKQQKELLKVAQKSSSKNAKSDIKVAQKSTDKKSENKLSKKSTSSSTEESKSTKTAQLAKSNKQLYIQLGAFHKETNAQKLAQRATILTQALGNFDVKVVTGKLENKDSYKVRIGPFKDQQQAQHLQKKLVALNGGQSKLIYD